MYFRVRVGRKAAIADVWEHRLLWKRVVQYAVCATLCRRGMRRLKERNAERAQFIVEATFERAQVSAQYLALRTHNRRI